MEEKVMQHQLVEKEIIKHQKHFHSVFDNEQQLLKAIILIHNKGETFEQSKISKSIHV